MRAIDLFEIVLVAIVFYRLYMMMRGTLAVSLFAGLIGLLVVQFVVEVTDMKILQSMFAALSDIYVLAAIMCFSRNSESVDSTWTNPIPAASSYIGGSKRNHHRDRYRGQYYESTKVRGPYCLQAEEWSAKLCGNWRIFTSSCQEQSPDLYFSRK